MPLLWEKCIFIFSMPKRIKIAPHLSTDELEKRYRQATNAIERSGTRLGRESLAMYRLSLL